MYSRCLFCSRDLGRNGALRAFPVGRRLAYDAAKGRLWVVCAGCGRWNLTPLEERWEAIEQAERLYRDARLRVSTDNVGLARVAGRTDLVRIGAALRPEFAAWRYGRQFGARQRRYLARVAVAVPAVAAVAGGVVGVPYVALGTISVGGGVVGATIGAMLARYVYQRVAERVFRGVDVALRFNKDRVVAWLPADGDERRLPITFAHLWQTRLGRDTDGALTVDVAHEFGRRAYAGAEAGRVLSLLMSHVNQTGASRAEVRDAVQAIAVRGGPEPYLRRIAHTSRRTHLESTGATWIGTQSVPESGLFALSHVQALALEMALREDVERRAMDGELAELERAWRDAEEIAAIADDLVVPDRVLRAFARLRGRTGG